MTPEQLEQIEKLAEAATPGPWTASLTDRGHALWGPLPSGDWGTMRIALSSYAEFDRANMLFMEALRDAALPLVKAVREARAAVKEWQTHAKEQQEAFAFWFRAANDTAKERDEARAEVERLKALLENKP